MLGLNQISIRELPLLANAIQNETNNKEETLLHLKAIDDMLSIQKSSELYDTFGIHTKAGFKRKGIKKFKEVLEDRITLLNKQINTISQQ